MRGWVLLAVALLVVGCMRPGDGNTTLTPTPTASPGPGPGPGPGPEYLPKFDGDKAYRNVVEQVFGADGAPRYRIPGTPGNDEVARLIDDRMTALGYHVTWDHFNATYGCEQVPMHNIVAERAGASGFVVVFAAHYDTRPVADKDPTLADQKKPVLGANDGASGVAVLLELARVLPPSEDAVRFLFFDGEDGGGRWARTDCNTDWILGSRSYAEALSEDEVASIRALVLVDMVGDPELVIPREGYSADGPGKPVQDALFARAAALGHEQFHDVAGAQILDDHVPFLERRAPAVDLIHTIPGNRNVFPSWHHTLDDDMDAVSAQSLNAVGETMEAWFAGLG